MLRCAWLPPTFAIEPGSSGVRLVGGAVGGGRSAAGQQRHRRPTGRVAVGARSPERRAGGCGISAMREGVRLLAARCAEREAAADVDRRPALQVRQGEVRLPVPAEGGAEQREQRLVLVDRQELPVAQRPALRGEHEAHDPDLRQERFGHSAPFGRGRCPRCRLRTLRRRRAGGSRALDDSRDDRRQRRRRHGGRARVQVGRDLGQVVRGTGVAEEIDGGRSRQHLGADAPRRRMTDESGVRRQVRAELRRVAAARAARVAARCPSSRSPPSG